MTTLHRTALVPYSAEQMFILVNDIERYHEFLPWCYSSTVLARNEKEITATIEVSAKGVHKGFTTRNFLVPNKEMKMLLVEGPFKHFSADWLFKDLSDEGCKISLDMDFEFSSKIMSILLGKVFNRAVNHMVEAFSARADALYGK